MTEETIKEIAEQCGTIRSIRSYIDSTKGFSLVTFSGPEGVYLAELLLKGLVLDGQALTVHLNRSTKSLLISLQAERSEPKLPTVDEKLEKKARENVRAILGQRDAMEDKIAEAANVAAMNFLTSLHGEPDVARNLEILAPPKARSSLHCGGSDQDLWYEALRSLQKNERERLRKHELEIDKLRDLVQERQRQIAADSEILDPRIDEPIHHRKAYRHSREHIERRKRAEKEMTEDLSEEERCTNENQTKKPARFPSTAREMLHKNHIMFDEDDAHMQQKRPIHIQYSKEEMEPGKTRASKESIKRSIMAKIPKSMEELERYNIKWEYFDRAGTTVHRKILGWIGKKIRELMGEDELSFCEFIFQELISHRAPTELICNLTEVLDEDTESFVVKLFGVVIYETERMVMSYS